MQPGRLDSLRHRARALFAERHVFVRTRRHVRGFVVSPRQQMIAVAVLGAVATWTIGATLAAGREAIVDINHRRAAHHEASAAAALAARVEARQAALARLLASAAPPSADGRVIAAAANASPAGADPLGRIAAVGLAEGRVVEVVDTMARARAEQLRQTMRAAGLDPARYAPAEGGPLIRPGDPIARLARSDETFYESAARAAGALSGARRLAQTARALPLGRPVAGATQSSGFGVRADPFTGEAAFHSGQDFAAAYLSPVAATGAGVVSFAGQRSGYGNTVEITHTGGLMTRYGHLAAIGVRLGQRVASGQVIGALGSTGRSTGPHLHYEVWLDGRAENPMRFVAAGDRLAAR